MIEITAPAYQKTDLFVRSNVEPHDAPLDQLSDLVGKTVEIEGPIHAEEIARRVSSAFGKARIGHRIVTATQKALKHASRRTQGHILQNGEFWLTEAQSKDPPVRDRSDEWGAILKASTIPPMEIQAAVALIQKESGTMDLEEMVRAVARLMGFQWVSSDLQEVIKGALRLEEKPVCSVPFPPARCRA